MRIARSDYPGRVVKPGFYSARRPEAFRGGVTLVMSGPTYTATIDSPTPKEQGDNLKRLACGDDECWVQLATLVTPTLFGGVERVLRRGRSSDVAVSPEDLVQDLLLKVWELRKNGGSDLWKRGLSYLYVMARNFAIDELRRNTPKSINIEGLLKMVEEGCGSSRNSLTFVVANAICDDNRPDRNLIHEELQAELAWAISVDLDKETTRLVKYVLKEVPLDEIAKAEGWTDLPENTVKTRVWRAPRKLAGSPRLQSFSPHEGSSKS